MQKTRIAILIAVLVLSCTNVRVAKAQGQFVGSINSDVYHYPSCTYAKKIKPENMPDLVNDERSPSEISEKIVEMGEIERRIRKLQQNCVQGKGEELLKALRDLQRCKAEILGDAKECRLGQE